MKRIVLPLLVVSIWLLLPATSHAATAFDCGFEKGANGQTSPFAFASNAGTVTCTPAANANRVLICTVSVHGWSGAPSAEAMTWNSVSMTFINSAAFTFNAGADYVYLFGLINPASGSQTISFTFSGGVSGNMALGCSMFSGANQSTGWQNYRTDTATGTSASSTVTSASGNMVVVAHQNDDASSTTINTGTTSWLETSLAGNHAMGYSASSGTSTTVAWTLGSSKAWGNAGVDVIAAGGAAPTVTCIVGGGLICD